MILFLCITMHERRRRINDKFKNWFFFIINKETIRIIKDTLSNIRKSRSRHIWYNGTVKAVCVILCNLIVWRHHNAIINAHRGLPVSRLNIYSIESSGKMVEWYSYYETVYEKSVFKISSFLPLPFLLNFFNRARIERKVGIHTNPRFPIHRNWWAFKSRHLTTVKLVAITSVGFKK